MTKVVERKPLSALEQTYLPTLVSGFKVTWKHFTNTVFKGKAVTMEYPEERWVVPEGYRGAPYLVKDQDNNTKCVSCQLCEFVCPPKAIKITPPGPDGATADRANAEKMPREFEINMLRCIFCGYCQDACPTGAIVLRKDFELANYKREQFLFTKEMLLEDYPGQNLEPYKSKMTGAEAPIYRG